MRFAVVVVAGLLAGLALATGSGTGATGLRRGPNLGVLPGLIHGKLAPAYHGPRPGGTSSFATIADNLTYLGGPVLHSSNAYTIFWAPSGFRFPLRYQALVDRYFHDVAAASGTNGNAFAAMTQYYDTSGPIAYDSKFGGTFVDTAPYPASGCTVPTSVESGDRVCLTEDQESAEVKRVADALGWPHGANGVFFLYTPENVASCFGDGASGECSYNDFCAYHNGFSDSNDQLYLWANMPFPNQSFSGQELTFYPSPGWPNSKKPGHLNADAADEVISSSSHEYNESISDPLGTGWVVEDGGSGFAGDEMADLCSYEWLYAPIPLRGRRSSYDQLINGHRYATQGEWSNSTATSANWSGCVFDGRPAIGATATTVGQTLTGSVGVWPWTGQIVNYTFTWRRCDALGKACRTISSETTGENSSSYTLRKADARATIRLSVSAPGSGVMGSRDSTATAKVGGEPVDIAPPTISGSAVVGQTLSGSVGFWSGNRPITYSYAWLECDALGANCATAATGATDGSSPVEYTLGSADDRKTIVFEVRAVNAVGHGKPAESLPTAPVGGEPEGGAPTLSGTAAVGDTLTANLDAAGWTNSPTAFRVVWRRTLNGRTTTIQTSWVAAGGADPTYTLVPADDRATIAIRVRASNAAGTSRVAVASVGPVSGQPIAKRAPSVHGIATVGKTLTGHAGSWSPVATSYVFEWLLCNANGNACVVSLRSVSTVRTSAYRIESAAAGHTLRLRVTAVNAAGTSNPATTAATAVVAK